MGIYQNSQQAFFQFDKTYDNRKTMEEQCAAGTDHVFVGRFVLISYGGSGFGAFIGYWYNNQIYLDINHQHSYTYVTGPSYASSATDVYPGFIVKVFYENSESFSYYQCTGGDNQAPIWEEIQGVIDNSQNNYLSNYAIDQEYYGQSFDKRGYDGTIWTKVVSEGQGHFVQVARMSGDMPRFEMVSDPPSISPTSAYIGTEGAPDLYVIHTPTHWGFQIKAADENDEARSDVSVNGQDLAVFLNLGTNSADGPNLYHMKESHVDDSTNTISITPTGQSGTLYNNQAQNDMLELEINLPIIGNMIDKGYDLIYGPPTITSDGSNGNASVRALDINWYDAKSNLKEDGDENLGGKNYALNTLAGNINTFHKRLGQNICYDYEDKPSTAQAASLNSNYIYYIKNENRYYRVGQSLKYADVPLNNIHFRNITLYSDQEFTTNTYYIHTVTSGPDSASVDVDPEHIDRVEYNSNTGAYDIYKKSVNNGSVHHYAVAISYSDSVQYAVKDISIEMYRPANIDYYQAGQYYRIVNDDYILDMNPDVPTDISAIYCTLDQNQIEQKQFTQAYESGHFYTKENKNYILATEMQPELDTTYVFPTMQQINGYITLYQKNKYYIIQNGEYKIDTRDYLPMSDSENNHHYIIEFEEDASIGRDEQGNIIAVYHIAEGYPKNVWLYATEQNVDYYLRQDNGDMIHVDNLEDLSITSNQFYKRTSTDAAETVESNKLFIPGKYYRLVNGHDYHLETVFDQVQDANFTYFYYIGRNAINYTRPFYEASKYYYRESGSDFFHMDHDNPSVYNQHYEKQALYVKSDKTGRCLIGMEWNSYALFVPASVELGILTSVKDLVPMDGIVDDSISLHGALLKFDRIYNPDDTKTRDLSTLMGAINTIQDLFYSIKHLIPGRVLYVNDFGQITSSEEGLTYADLTKAVKKIEDNFPD